MNTGAQHIRAALHAWLERPNSWLIGENVGLGGGVAGSTVGLLAAHPGKVIDTPIGDRSALGLGIGLAMAGDSVCVELSSLASLLGAASLLADLSQLSQTEFQPALTIRVPAGGDAGPGVDAPVGGLLASLPGISTVSLTSATAGAVLSHALGSGVTVVLESRQAYGNRAEAVPFCDLITHRAGTHVSLATWGAGIQAAVDAADNLAREGIEVEVLELVSIHPPSALLTEHLIHTGRLVIAHPGSPAFSRQLQQVGLDQAFLYLESPLRDCSTDPKAIHAAVRSSVLY